MERGRMQVCSNGFACFQVLVKEDCNMEQSDFVFYFCSNLFRSVEKREGGVLQVSGILS